MYSFHAMRSKLPLAALKTAVHLVAQQPFVQKKVQKLGEKTCCQKIVSYPACTTAASVPEKERDIEGYIHFYARRLFRKSSKGCFDESYYIHVYLRHEVENI